MTKNASTVEDFVDPNPDLPTVSVLLLTYNHGSFIAPCIESILTQKTNFSFEICIGEDASEDETREICESYKNKYPAIINLFCRDRKDVIYIDGKPTGRRNFVDTLMQCGGKYVALCEGDDYWTDPEKLQKQVDFLKENTEIIICGHRNLKVDTEGQVIGKSPHYPCSLFTQSDIAKKNPLSTMTVVFRNEIKVLPDWFLKCPLGDWALYMLLTDHGNAWIMPDIMAAYRRHGGSSWTGTSNRARFLKMRAQLILFTTIFPQYKNIFDKSLKRNQIGILYWSKFEISKMLHCLFLIIITPKSEITIRDFLYKIRSRKLFNDLK